MYASISGASEHMLATCFIVFIIILSAGPDRRVDVRKYMYKYVLKGKKNLIVN